MIPVFPVFELLAGGVMGHPLHQRPRLSAQAAEFLLEAFQANRLRRVTAKPVVIRLGRKLVL